MDSRPIGIAALALGIIGAAGVGSYLALRPTQPPAAVATTAQNQPAGTPASTASPTAPKPVTETEGTVAPDSKAASKVDQKAEPIEAPKPSASAPAKKPSPKSDKTDASSRRPAAAPATASRTPAPPVGTVASRDPYGSGQSGYGSASGPNAPAAGSNGTSSPYRDHPAGENPANVQPPVSQTPVEQAPPPEPPAPPRPRFEELQIPADSVIGLRLDDSISSETARVEDRVEARVSRDVRVNGEIAVPAGTRARGNVTLVEGGGKFKERARLGVRFHTLVLADGSTIPIQTETIYREGQEMTNKSAAKIGGAAAAGALIGAIFGGGKGAAIGGAAGAGAGTAATAVGPRSQATLIAGSTVTVRLSNPATVTIEK
jgi:hypothetical protein